MLAYLNGQFVPRATASIPVEDRGFIFGDGVYEVWRVVAGRLFENERHLARLESGLRELRIPAPEIVDRDAIESVARRLLADSGLIHGEATFYVEITRGVAPRTHQFPPAGTPPTVFAMANRFTPPDAVRARGASCITTPDIRWARCDIKTIQLLPNILAKQAAAERDAIDALMIRDGVVTESSHANIMAVIDGVVRTHPTDHRILAGVTRAVVLEIASELGIPVREEPFAEADIARADELFLVGTTTDVMPIVRVNDVVIAGGTPGVIAKRLHAELRARLDAKPAAERATSRAMASS
ncbi:MAG TPA: aminotransferase class IV [Gemmatimonadaceae bacterium]|nr:aminotransferase class IV [Gemmatimonadaceae bacterium]